MKKDYVSALVSIIIIGVVLAVVNTLLYISPDMATSLQNFIYPLVVTYVFFLALSLIIVGILIKVNQTNNQQLGFAFLLLTGVKMAISYFMARPILTKTVDDPTEKINFFIIFLMFLAIEAYYTARLLNKKQ